MCFAVGTWKGTLKVKHWTFLLDNLNTDKMADQLLQGVEDTPLVTKSVYEEIKASTDRRRSNEIFINHLVNRGTEESIRLFCEILEQSSQNYPIHKVVADKLKEDF